MVDFFLLLMLAGSGDELQGIKRGIMEMADALVITKADGDNLQQAIQAQTKFKNALHFFPASDSGWIPKVLKCSSFSGLGLTEIWETILEFVNMAKQTSWFQNNRDQQAVYWLEQTIEESMKQHFYNDPVIIKELNILKKEILSGKTSPVLAANKILENYFKIQE
jgi:LAO/AO transport system kinase